MASAAPAAIDVQFSSRVTVTELSKWDDDAWAIIAVQKRGDRAYSPNPVRVLGFPEPLGGFGAGANGADLALARLRQRRPNWFRKDIEYPEEDFSIGDLSGVDVDVED